LRRRIFRRGAAASEREDKASQSAALQSDSPLDPLIQVWDDYVIRRTERWMREYASFPYDRIDGQYVYMPLNFSWDAPHRAWNPMNYMQEYIVRIAAASLPSGCQLVIKEHPYGLGEPTHAQLRELQAIGVRVVDPSTHSLDLIRGAAAVFCVGDTTGWEAILYQVPVIVFGADPFYTAFPGLWNIKDPNDVHHALREAVRRGSRAYSQHEDAWCAVVQSAIESSHPGNIWGYRELVWVGENRSDGNLRDIARMIARELALPSDASGDARAQAA
jgi:hypothetical protein